MFSPLSCKLFHIRPLIKPQQIRRTNFVPKFEEKKNNFTESLKASSSALLIEPLTVLIWRILSFFPIFVFHLNYFHKNLLLQVNRISLVHFTTKWPSQWHTNWLPPIRQSLARQEKRREQNILNNKCPKNLITKQKNLIYSVDKLKQLFYYRMVCICFDINNITFVWNSFSDSYSDVWAVLKWQICVCVYLSLCVCMCVNMKSLFTCGESPWLVFLSSVFNT